MGIPGRRERQVHRRPPLQLESQVYPRVLLSCSYRLAPWECAGQVQPDKIWATVKSPLPHSRDIQDTPAARHGGQRSASGAWPMLSLIKCGDGLIRLTRSL